MKNNNDDKFVEAFVFLLQYGWLGVMGLVNIISVIKTPNENMLTRGVICIVGFIILAELRFNKHDN